MYRCYLQSWIKLLLILLMIYLLNLFFGIQHYIWSEKSFDNEYHLNMFRIDLNKIDENHPEIVLGQPKYLILNDFLIRNEYLCFKNENENRNDMPHLLILVKSAVNNYQARQAIRLTWANKKIFKNYSFQIGFVLGNNKKNDLIEKEFEIYQDLIQIDHIDTYYENTYKMIMMLRWIDNYCRFKSNEYLKENLRNYVLFIDDDYYLNLDSLFHYLNRLDQNKTIKNEDRKRFLTGYVYNRSRPRRFRTDRWFISMDDYPYDYYPPYVTAGCFLMTKSNAILFNLASKYIPLFRFDDIYIGLLAYAMSIPMIENNFLFSSYDSSSSFVFNSKYLSKWNNWLKNSFGNQSIHEKAICLHGYRGKYLIQLWNEIYQTNITLKD